MKINQKFLTPKTEHTDEIFCLNAEHTESSETEYTESYIQIFRHFCSVCLTRELKVL